MTLNDTCLLLLQFRLGSKPSVIDLFIYVHFRCHPLVFFKSHCHHASFYLSIDTVVRHQQQPVFTGTGTAVQVQVQHSNTCSDSKNAG